MTGCQFSFTCDGSLRRAPMATHWERARAVAEAALNGYVYAPAGWATHYHANYVVPYWASSLVKSAIVGTHIFYRWRGGWGRAPAFLSRYAGVEPAIAWRGGFGQPTAAERFAAAEAGARDAAAAAAALDAAPIGSVDSFQRAVLRRYEPLRRDTANAMIAERARADRNLTNSQRWALTGATPTSRRRSGRSAAGAPPRPRRRRPRRRSGAAGRRPPPAPPPAARVGDGDQPGSRPGRPFPLPFARGADISRPMNPLFASLPTSIFEHMSGLARDHRAVNLGQGFPDFGWPEDVLDRAAEAVRTGWNQYPPMRGLPELREAVAAHYRRHEGLDVAGRPGRRHLGRHRGAGLEPDRLDRAGRRGRPVPAALRRLSAAGAARRRRAALRPADAARLADHPRGAGRGVRRAHPPGPVQQPAQSDRAGVRRRGAAAARRGLRRARRDRAQRRGLGSMSCSTAAATCRCRRCRAWRSGRSRSARRARSSR